MPISHNKQTGETLYLNEQGQWQPAKVVTHPQTGEKLAFDGAEWKPVKKKAKKEPTMMDEVDGAISSFLNTAVPFGLNDTIGGYGRMLGEHVAGLMTGETPD